MHTYADLGWRTPFVVVAVSTNAVLGLVTSTLGMLFDEASPDLTLAALILPAFFGSLASFLVAIVAVCLWTYRACANAHALVGDWVAPSVSPAFAVGSYFIPFVNLVRPYQAMREIDSASLGAASTDSMVGLWWGTWIAGNILGNIGFRFESPTADLISSVVHLASAVLLALVVRRIHEAQRSRREELRREGAPDIASFRDAPTAAVAPDAP